MAKTAGVWRPGGNAPRHWLVGKLRMLALSSVSPLATARRVLDLSVCTSACSRAEFRYGVSMNNCVCPVRRARDYSAAMRWVRSVASCGR